MDFGLNIGFGNGIGREKLASMKELGFGWARTDIPLNSPRVEELVGEFAGTLIRPLFLLTGGHDQPPPAELADWAEHVAASARAEGVIDKALFEPLNEPNIDAHYGSSPSEFARAVRMCQVRIRKADPSARVIAGGIHDTRADALDYLEAAVGAGLPVDVGMGFHTYHTGDHPRVSHRGFENREAEMARLRKIAGGRPLYCTEVGFHTAPFRHGFLKIFRRKFSDDQVADFWDWEARFHHREGVRLVICYQAHDGPNPKFDQDRYGAFQEDRATVKSWAKQIRTLREELA